MDRVDHENRATFLDEKTWQADIEHNKRWQEIAAKLMQKGTSLHCKGLLPDNELDVEEFHHCLRIVQEADFDGHISLIYACCDGEWDNVLRLKEETEAFFNVSSN